MEYINYIRNTNEYIMIDVDKLDDEQLALYTMNFNREYKKKSKPGIIYTNTDDIIKPPKLVRVKTERINLPPRYKSYLNRANSKSLPFELSIEEFDNILSQPCIYCGDDGITGIDRKDNSQGYTIDNS